MRAGQTQTVKPEWFGRNVNILLANDKKLSGELSEVTPSYLVLNTPNGETQVMLHAIFLIRLSETDEE